MTATADYNADLQLFIAGAWRSGEGRDVARVYNPATGAPIFVKTGRYGPYVEMELPEEEKPVELTKAGKPKKQRGRPKKALKRASIPPGTDLSSVTLADALHYLSLPRELGNHPGTGKPVMANVGRFGPYVGHDGEFRSLKGADDPYTITLDRAVEILAEPKRPPKGVDIVREVGKHPKTGKNIVLYKSKAGHFLKKGLRRIYLPESQNPEALTPEEAAAYLA